jgi:hypothetical protein
MIQRQRVELTWGDALVLKVHKTRVGLKPFVDSIQAAVGRHIGSRPTFAKLYDVESVDDLSEIEAYRAWLLLTAMGEDPDDWGVRASVVPQATNVERLRELLTDQVRHQGLEPRTRWFKVYDNVVAENPWSSGVYPSLPVKFVA